MCQNENNSYGSDVNESFNNYARSIIRYLEVKQKNEDLQKEYEHDDNYQESEMFPYQGESDNDSNETNSKQFRERHDVDMGDVCVPHFGVHLEENDFEEVKRRIEASDIDYFDKPYRRFIGSKFEQETFFVEDPNGNVLEIKTMSNPEVLFETAS